MSMTSTRPYLIRAIYEWIVDNGNTPYIIVNSEVEGTMVPVEFVKGGRIILNIAMSAVDSLVLGNSAIEFQARFGGRVRRIYAPAKSILAIYAKENGKGMVFEDEMSELETPESNKFDDLIDESGMENGMENETENSDPKSNSYSKSNNKQSESNPNSKKKPNGKPKPPHLTIVK